jgi:hypothetical protein
VREPAEVRRSIAVAEEDVLAPVAALGHVMGNAGKHDARDS